MIAEGTLRDLTFEWGNMLAKVDLDHPFKEPDERLVQLFRDNYSMEKNGNLFKEAEIWTPGKELNSGSDFPEWRKNMSGRTM